MPMTDLVIALLPPLQLYHLTVSTMAALGAVMAMQFVGHRWTSTWGNTALQQMQRAGLGALSIALFCSGLRVPDLAICAPWALVSAAAVNTGILIALIPTAIVGRRMRAISS
jgi:hypothetical protein